MNGIKVLVFSLATDGNSLVKATCPNFKVREFACKDGSDTILISEELVEVLQKIRTHFGGSVHINSAYRTDSWNRLKKGSATSKHRWGLAADITVKDGNGKPVAPVDVAKFAETVLKTHGGIGVYDSWTHIDTRPTRYRSDRRGGKEKAVSGWY